MKCKLCEKEIENYEPRLNHFKIDKDTSAEICEDCIKKFAKWQQETWAELFPTKYAKKRFGKDKLS